MADGGAAGGREAFLKLAKYPLVAQSDMGADVRTDVLDICTAALERYAAEGDRDKATQAIADGLGRRYGGPWHVVVGHNFHYNITHEDKHLMHFYVGGTTGILVWKA